VSWPAIRHRNT
ncbi:acetyltransferase family protein, partial [Vibrio parahaemolyticus V-223/04]